MVHFINFVFIMNISLKYILPIFVFICSPILCFATVVSSPNIEFRVQVLSIFNFALIIVSLVAIKQFFWPKEKNHTIFQVFNMVFTIVYYIVSIRFILSHRAYYEGFENLTDWQIIRRSFLDFNKGTVFQLIILFSFIINILYIKKHGKRFYLDIE